MAAVVGAVIKPLPDGDKRLDEIYELLKPLIAARL